MLSWGGGEGRCRRLASGGVREEVPGRSLVNDIAARVQVPPPAAAIRLLRNSTRCGNTVAFIAPFVIILA
jgi:hypothetical protein